MWQIEFLPEVREWVLGQSGGTKVQITAALDLLAERGPNLGRPLADTIAGSSLKNLKELRPGSTGNSEIRILFIFDPKRRAVLLVAGDKQARYVDWYRENIPLAEARYALYLKGMNDE